MVPAIRYTAVLMLVGMLLQINCVPVYYGLFLLNRKAITETVCEQRTMDCYGRCYLQKKIDATQTPEPSAPETTPAAKTLEQLLNILTGLLPDNQHSLSATSADNIFSQYHLYLLCDGVTRPIEHPPNA